MFESIGSLKYPMVQFSNRSTYKFFSANFKQVQKALFFGDSNNQELILTYDFFKDAWAKREVLKRRFKFAGSSEFDSVVVLSGDRLERRMHSHHRRPQLFFHKRVWLGLPLQH